jgi:hypothetical protein
LHHFSFEIEIDACAAAAPVTIRSSTTTTGELRQTCVQSHRSQTNVFYFQCLTRIFSGKKRMFPLISITYAYLKSGKIMSFVEFQTVKLWRVASAVATTCVRM